MAEFGPSEDKRLSERVAEHLLDGWEISDAKLWETIQPEFPRHSPTRLRKRYAYLLSVGGQVPRNRLKVGYSENQGTATALGHQIHTLEQLIEAAEIDLDTHKIDDHIINKWDVGMKHPDTGQPIISPLWQVKAWLRRKVLEETQFPPIAPVFSNVAAPEKPTPQRTGIRRALIIPDSQNGYMRDMQTGKLDPFHDRRCWDLAVQLAEDLQPDTIILLGDMLDLPDWSEKFVQSPECYHVTQPALVELHWHLARLRQVAPGAEMIYIEGNHEERILRQIFINLKAAFHLKPADNVTAPDILSIPTLLGLDTLGVTYIGDYPNGEYWLNDNLCAHHGEIARNTSGGTAGAEVSDARCSSIFGHSHRLEMASKTTYSRRGAVSYRAFTLGTIARVPGPTPAAKGKAKNDWQQALGVVDYELGNGMFEVYPLYIHDGKLIFEGQKYEGDDHLDALRETGWNF